MPADGKRIISGGSAISLSERMIVRLELSNA